MKKNKSRQIDEGFLDALIGDTGAAGLKSMFKKGMTKQAQLAQDLFIKDFVGDAVASLSAGVKGGFVNPSISNGPAQTSPQKGASNDASMAVKTAAARTNTQPPASAAAVPTTSPTQVPPAQQTGQAMNNQQTANARMQSRAGVTPTGQRMTQAQMTRARMQDKKMQAARKPKPVSESSTYDRLNALFESIMEAQGGQSIAKYMESWFNKYMGGVDWQSHGGQVRPLLQAVQDTYGKDKGVRAIRQLAQAAFAIAKTSGATPAGAEDIKGQAGTQPAQGQAQNPAMTVKDIRAALPNMRLRDLQALKQAIDAVIAAKAKPAQAGAAPAPTPTPTSESRKYRR